MTANHHSVYLAFARHTLQRKFHIYFAVEHVVLNRFLRNFTYTVVKPYSPRATNRSVRFTESNQELGSLDSCWVRGAKLKFGKLGTSYVVAVRFANIFIKFLSNWSLSNFLVRATFECSNQRKLFQTRIIRAESYLENLKPKPKNYLRR